MNSAPISLLIVDDDPVFTRFARQIIASLEAEFPCITRSADSAAKALEEISRHVFDLVLLDYHLPDRDGLEVLGEIRRMEPTRQPAVVMLTASGNEMVAVEAMKRGAKDYLKKATLDVPSLMRALQSALAQKRLAEKVAAYDAQMASDLKMARNLQKSLLPAEYPLFVASGNPAVQFAHRFFPASQLAGDFFSVQHLPGNRAGIFICDVMGHGIRSALVTAMLRALVDDLAPLIHEPGKFLAEINGRLVNLFKQAGETLYVTAFYLVADFSARKIIFANAGHPKPIWLRPGREAVSLASLQHGGPGLGLFVGANFPSAEESIVPGDTLLLFTDGLFEATDASGTKDFGPARLVATAQASRAEALPELLDGIVQEVRTFAGGTEFADDVCLLGIKFLP